MEDWDNVKGSGPEKPEAFKAFKGTFITFEGCEGSGKTTQAEILKDYFLDRGMDALLCRQPGGTPVGQKIRDMLLDPECSDLLPITETLLFAADRAQQVAEVVVPALKQGHIVIMDRYIDSSLAYQGVGRGCGLEAVKNLNEWACGGVMPDMTIFLDLPVAEGLARAKTAGIDRIEGESLQFHENVRHAYNMLMRIYSHRYRLIDGHGTPQQVHARVVNEVSKVI